jgi:hypothetical protein
MNTPMIDRAMRQIVNQRDLSMPIIDTALPDRLRGDVIEITPEAIKKAFPIGAIMHGVDPGSESGDKEKVFRISKEQANAFSKSMLLRSITHSLECLAEDDPQPAIRAALEAVRAIK